MIVKKTDIIKLIKKELLETRFIMSKGSDAQVDDKDALSAKEMAKEIGKNLKFKKFDSNEEFKDFLFDIAGPDTFISFIDTYEHEETTGEEKVPSFSLNPNATFNTPHGLYFYPFDKENAKRYIYLGKPTNANFAVDRPYFHLVKIDIANPEVLVFKKNGETNKKISPENFKKDLKEMIRIHLKFFDKTDSIQEIYDKLNNEFKSYKKITTDSLRFSKKNEKNLDLYINKLSNNNYYKLYKYAYYLSSETVDQTSSPHSELFALLLNRINIKCVIDQDMSIIHPSEPEQAHILTFGENKSFYEYIGTFENKIEKVPSEDMIEAIKNIKDVSKKLEIIKYFDRKKLNNKSIMHPIYEDILNNKNNKNDINKFLDFINQHLPPLTEDSDINSLHLRTSYSKDMIPETCKKFLKENFKQFYLENVADISLESNIERLIYGKDTISYSLNGIANIIILYDFRKMKESDKTDGIISLLTKLSLKGHDDACIKLLNVIIDQNVYIDPKQYRKLIKAIPASSVIPYFNSKENNSKFTSHEFLKGIIDDNINDLKKIESIYAYVKNVMDKDDQKYILDYIKSKNKIHESIKKLKLLIKKQIKYLN